MVRGFHPHSSHGQGATIAGLTCPSATQVAWLVSGLHHDKTGRRPRPSAAAAVGLNETFARYGLARLADRTAWERRSAKSDAPAVPATAGGDFDVFDD